MGPRLSKNLLYTGQRLYVFHMLPPIISEPNSFDSLLEREPVGAMEDIAEPLSSEGATPSFAAAVVEEDQGVVNAAPVRTNA